MSNPDCKVNRLSEADPERDISQAVYCPCCDICVDLDADAPRIHLETEFVYDIPDDDTERLKYAYPVNDSDLKLKRRRVPKFKCLFPFKAGYEQRPFEKPELDEELSGHAVFQCTSCGNMYVNNFSYTHDDDEWEEIKEERENE